MKLIVGLGNPGKEYENTRHNIGFMCIDNYCQEYNFSSFQEKFNGLYLKEVINGETVIFLKPLSFMNLSGTVVKKYIDYFKIDINDILIIHDDLDMPVGKIKLKQNGSSGGHNGIKNIILEIGTEEFKHLKIGISKDNNYDIKDYVLGKFKDDDLNKINNTIKLTKNILDEYLSLGFEKVMNKYNGANNEFNK